MNRIKKLSLLIGFLIIIAGILTACSNPAGIVKISFTVDGEIYREYNLEYGNGLLDIPEVPEKNGYIGAWNVENFKEFYKDTTVTAVYTKNFFTVTFKADNFIVRTTNVTLGENPSSLPDIPEKGGYEGEWEITDFTSLTVDTIVKAIYTPIKLTLTFKYEFIDKNDEIIKGEITRQVDYGTDLSDIPSVPQKEGFVGVWDVEDFTNIKQNLTIIADYSTPKIITINYKHGDIKPDSVSDSVLTRSYEQQLPLPTQQTEEDFIFYGWYFDDGFQDLATSITLYDDIDVYAYWIEVNHSVATNADLFEFEEIEGGIKIAPKFGAVLPKDVILPNSCEVITVVDEEEIIEKKLVTKIAAGAFENFANLETIVIPVGVVEIGARAFEGCSNLAEVTFVDGNRLRKIGDYAFYQNSSLVSIDLTNDIEEIGDYAFSECTSLNYLAIAQASNLKTIGNYAFANSSGIHTINISPKIIIIGDYAFSALNNTVLNFEGLENLESVGKFAFRNCNGLTSFNASKITSIGEGAFAGCAYLEELTITAELPIADYFGENSFNNSYEVSQISRLRDFNGEFVVDEQGNYVLTTIQRRLPIALKTIRIQEGVEDIADYVLNNCVAINNIYVPSSVKTIGVLAFAAEGGDSNNLMRQGEVVFENNSELVEIGIRAFYGRTSINAIVLPPSLKRIGNDAFRIASNLNNIVLGDSDNLEFIGSYAFLNTDWYNRYGEDIVYLGNIAIGYKGSSPSDISIASGTKAIAPYAFAGSNRILSVNIPSSVEIINEYAFSQCTNLTSVVIVEEAEEKEGAKVIKGVKKIMGNAFAECIALKTINIPKCVETIGMYILKGCNSIETMEVYGDRTLGDFFGNDVYENSYQINQIQLSYKNCDIVADEEDENKFYITWEESKHLYGGYPVEYNIIVSNSIDLAKNIVQPFVLGTFTHNPIHSSYYSIDDSGKYVFNIAITRTEVATGIYRYVITGLGDYFYTEKPAEPDESTEPIINIGDFITIESRFNNDYYIPQSLRKIVFINDDEAENRVIKPYSFMNLDSLEEVVFVEGIKEIGEGAFQNCISLGSKYVEENYITVPISLPSSLEIIGDSAFENNQRLREIIHSSQTSLKIIGKRAFAGSGLISFNVPETVDIIGQQAFMNNSNLSILTFNNPNVEIELGQVLNGLIIESQAFESCTAISNIVFPDRLIAIGDYAFSNNVILGSVSFGEESQLMAMGNKAFAHCAAMVSIILPKLLNFDTTSDILYDCGGLREITLYNTNAEDYYSATLGMLFGENSYSGSYQAVQNGTTYYIPNNLATINFLGGRIADYAFENVKYLKLVHLENVIEIGNYAFNNCIEIEIIDLPNTVTSIGEYAFNNCILMESFNFGEESELVKIGGHAFMNNVLLKDFHFPAGITVIESNTFNNCIELTNVDIQNITKIQNYAFYDCYNISRFDFSENIEVIGAYAFYNCSNAEIPYKKFDRLVSIGNYAFYNCLGLRYIHAENIEATGFMAYNGVYNLEELSLPGNTALGSVFGGAYYENSYSIEQNGSYFVPNKLKTIRVSAAAISLPSQAFKDCVSLSDIVFLSDQPPALGNAVIQNTSIELKLFVPYIAKELYQIAYADYADRLYTNPSNIEEFEFIENEDGYTLNTITAFSDTVLYIPAYYNDNPVTKIAPNAFKNNITITEVIIPNTIREIASSAFEGCLNIERVIFESGSNLTTIANKAFAYCDSLISIRIPKSVEIIGDYAFAGQRYLNGWNEYVYTSSLSEIVFEENSNLIYIGDFAFYLCDKLTNFSLPQLVQTIGKAAFRNSGLINIYFPEYSFIDTIAEEVFYGCESLQTITLPFNIQSIAKNAFSRCFSLAEITFNQNLQTIAERAFYNCISLLELDFPDGLISIHTDAFRYCTALESITIPHSVEYIGDYAFNGCSNLFEVNINDAVIDYIGQHAFLDTLWYQNQMEDNDDNEVLYISNVAYAYKGEMPANTVLTLAPGTIAISPRAFEGQSNLIEILIPYTVQSIGDYAFNNCSSLHTITFEENSQLQSIGKYAFEKTDLQNIALPQSVEIVGDYAFYNIFTLTSLALGDNLISIGKYAFANLNNADAAITLPTSLVSLGEKAFYYSQRLTITLPQDSALTYIGSKAFSKTKNIDIVFPQGINQINDAFSYTVMDEFVIPVWIVRISNGAFSDSVINKITLHPNNQLQEIGQEAFWMLEHTEISLNGLTKLKSIGSYAFFNCQGLQKLTSESVSEIGYGAFWGCNNLQELTTIGSSLLDIFDGWIPQTLITINIASGVTVVDESAFEGVDNIVNLNFSATIKHISQNAFKDATNLANIHFDIPDSLLSVGKDAFAGTQWLQAHSDGVVYIAKLVYSYKNDGTGFVSITAGTTAIAEYAFANSNIQSVQIPASVTSINEYAFAECSSLASIVFANGSTLHTIGKNAFQNCIGLESVSLPLNINSMGADILSGCYSIQNLNYNGKVSLGWLFGESQYDNSYIAQQNGVDYYIPSLLKNIRIIEGATIITAFAMQNCSSIETVIVSISVTEIQQAAFEGCSNINRLSIISGSQLTIIGDNAFAGCSQLTGLNLPATAVNIGQGILNATNFLTELTLSGSLQLPVLFGQSVYANSYDVELDGATYYLPQSLKSIVIALGSVEVAQKAYARTQIEKISIPLSVQTINSYAFYEATKLKELNIALMSNLIAIHSNAFNGCIALTAVEFNNNLQFIGERAFYNCTALQDIIIANLSCEIGDEAFEGTKWLDEYLDGDETVYNGVVYIGTTLVGYKGDMPAEYTLELAATTTDIAAYALAGQQNLVSIEIPASVKTIGVAAFKDCINLTSVVFLGSSMLTIINADMFNNTALQTITLPSGIQEIRERAFYANNNLQTVVFEQGSMLEKIASSAFENSALTEITIPQTVKAIEEDAFKNCINVEEIIFVDGSQLEEIGSSAFYNLSSATITANQFNNLLVIGDSAFYNCAALKSLIAPAIENIAQNSFFGCYSLEEITLPPNKRLFEVFGNCQVQTELRYDKIIFQTNTYTVPKTLKTVYLSHKATNILDNAFVDCISLESVYLTQSIAAINESAFKSCQSLVRVVGGHNIKSIGHSAFKDCIELLTTMDMNIEEEEGEEEGEEQGQDFVIPYTVKYIGNNAFENCVAIQKIVIEEHSQLEFIGSYAFNGLQNTDYDIATINKPISVGEGAFKDNKRLKSFIANNIVSVGVSAFSGCSMLEEISVTTTDYVGKIFGSAEYDLSYIVTFEEIDYYIPNSLTYIKVSQVMTNIASYTFAELNTIEIIELSNVTSIGQYAFLNNTSLSEIQIPDSVVSINDFAFSGCANLATIILELQDTLTYVGEAAFDDTAWYEGIYNNADNETIYIGRVAYKHKGDIIGALELSKNTIGISPNAFMGQTQITELHLPLTLSTIGPNAFQNCSGIQTIYTTGNYQIGKLFGLTQYPASYAAQQNGETYYIPSSLNNIYIIEGSTQIVDYAFANCISITNVFIAESINRIGEEVFNGCNSIETMTLSAKTVLGLYFGSTSYDETYAAVQNGTTYYIPSTLSVLNINGAEIVDYAFQDLVELQTANLSSNILSIGNYAFEGCQKLSGYSGNQLQNIKYIGSYAFANCTAITNMNFPAGAQLSDNVLSGCSNLNTLNAKGNKALHLLFGTSQYINSYAAEYANKIYYIPKTLTTINIINSTILADGLMQNFSELINLTLPSNITKVGSYAFYEATKLTGITLPSTMKEIGQYAFYNNRLNQFNIQNNNIERVGRNAFSNCYLLTEFLSPAIMSIGSNAFSGCYRLTAITILKDKVTGRYFGEQMFVNSYAVCQNSVTYYVPVLLTSIEVYGDGALPDYMFAGMNYLESVRIFGETEIPQNAFNGCTSITEFVGDDVVYIAEDALIQLPWLAIYFATLNNEIAYIGKVAYCYIGSLNIVNITLKEHTTQIYKNALVGLNRIVGLYITADIRHIDTRAFDGCNSLSNITVDENNEYFSSIDGVLYNKAGDTLIFTPSAHN